MADNPKPPSLGFGLNPLQNAALKVGKILLKFWFVIGLLIVVSRYAFGETPVWPHRLFFEVAAVGGLIVAGSLVVLSGAVWRGLWGFIRRLRVPALPKMRGRGYSSQETREGGKDDFDPSMFEDEPPQSGDRNFDRVERKKLTQRGGETAERRRNLLAIVNDPNAGEHMKAAAQKKLLALPAPPKQITKQKR